MPFAIGVNHSTPLLQMRKKLVRIPKISVKILLKNQEISAIPAVPTTRSLFINKLHDFMGIVCTLPCLNSGHFEVFESKLGSVHTGNGTFNHLVNDISPEILLNAYSAVEFHIQNLSRFVNRWLAYQTLWDTKVSEVASSVNGDINKWHELIIEASSARNTLDSTAAATKFGPIVVTYNKALLQVNMKLDSWQKELQIYFASVLADRMNEAFEGVSNAKMRLENTVLEGSSVATNEIVLGVTFLQEVTQKLPSWQKKTNELGDSEKLLKRQGHAFCRDWMESFLVVGLLQQVEQLLAREE